MAQSKLWKKLKQSTRIATSVTRRAVGEAGIDIPVRPVLMQSKELDKEYPGLHVAARASVPITWAVGNPGAHWGELLSPGTALGAARHEVAHIEGQVTTGRFTSHPAIEASRAEQSRVGMKHATRIEREPAGRIAQRLSRKRRPKRLSEVGVPGFSTPHLREAAASGTEDQKKAARMQMRKLGRRVRSRGIDF